MSTPVFASAAPHGASLDAAATAELLPWNALTAELLATVQDCSVRVPPRIVMPLPHGGSLFCMPASDAHIAMAKLITLTPRNAQSQRPTIQGEITIFDIATGQRQLVIDGPTVTARRTAAVTLLAAQHFAPSLAAPLLLIGAGVQGKAHLEAFAAGAGTSEVWIASRSASSVQRLLRHAREMGLQAHAVTDMEQALAQCPNIVTCTSAQEVVLHHAQRSDCFIAAVGAFTPDMVELSPSLCQRIEATGTILVDTSEALHEAGDLLQAGINVASLPTLAQCITQKMARPKGPVLFKSCGWGGWDLAAARLAARLHREMQPGQCEPLRSM